MAPPPIPEELGTLFAIGFIFFGLGFLVTSTREGKEGIVVIPSWKVLASCGLTGLGFAIEIIVLVVLFTEDSDKETAASHSLGSFIIIARCLHFVLAAYIMRSITYLKRDGEPDPFMDKDLGDKLNHEMMEKYDWVYFIVVCLMFLEVSMAANLPWEDNDFSTHPRSKGMPDLNLYKSIAMVKIVQCTVGFVMTLVWMVGSFEVADPFSATTVFLDFMICSVFVAKYSYDFYVADEIARDVKSKQKVEDYQANMMENPMRSNMHKLFNEQGSVGSGSHMTPPPMGPPPGSVHSHGSHGHPGHYDDRNDEYSVQYEEEKRHHGQRRDSHGQSGSGGKRWSVGSRSQEKRKGREGGDERGYNDYTPPNDAYSVHSGGSRRRNDSNRGYDDRHDNRDGGYDDQGYDDRDRGYDDRPENYNDEEAYYEDLQHQQIADDDRSQVVGSQLGSAIWAPAPPASQRRKSQVRAPPGGSQMGSRGGPSPRGSQIGSQRGTNRHQEEYYDDGGVGGGYDETYEPSNAPSRQSQGSRRGPPSGGGGNAPRRYEPPTRGSGGGSNVPRRYEPPTPGSGDRRSSRRESMKPQSYREQID